MVRLFLLAALALGTTSVATAGEQPVCANPGACGSDGGDGECSLWLQDGWVLAGKSYGTGQRVAWDDVAIPWTQHDRRAFPSWGRFAYFAQVPNEPYRYVFAPTFVTPFECHAVLRNLRHGPVGTDSAGLAPPLTAAHAVGKGDPLFLECADPEDGVNEHVYETPALDTETAVCLDGLTAKKSERAPLGAFATKKYEKGDALVRGPAMHLHRSELYNKTADKHEELLNYCFGHKDTDLLLLPYMPVVHSINHDDKDPNVVVEWDMPDRDVRSVLSRPATQVPAFAGGEDPALYLKYTALRDIQPGEELTMDYGPEWKRAWDGRDREKPFRHEIGFDLFPEEWLAEETRGAEFPAFDAERVPVGELKPATLRSGEVLAPYIHRTGLPEGFAGRVADWANDMGITNLMRSYLFGRQLEVDGEERVRINGGTWWVRRFASDWKSNLFYITPDDDESNEQFMHALGRAGWDQVLTGIGKHFDLNSLSCFYPSFIALTHSTYSMMHSDSDHDKIWNVIFPVVQDNRTNSAGVYEAEINLGRNENSPLGPLNVPYRYEMDHAVVLGLDGMHGTAPGDYRGTDGFRMVASIYMGDFTDDKMLDDYVAEWEDPPYPRRPQLRKALKLRNHWHKDDPNIHSGMTQVKIR